MSEFEKSAAAPPKTGFVSEFLHFLAHSKKWWLLPIVVILVLLGILIALSSSAAAPFVYTLF